MPSTRTMMISIHAPRVGRDKRNDKQRHHCKNFNPRAPCGARLASQNVPERAEMISIHAPRVGRDPCQCNAHNAHNQFQSTRPVWGATTGRRTSCSTRRYFNPRAPCGARLHEVGKVSAAVKISIHAPRVGRDSKFDDFTPSNLHKRYKRVLARPKNTREKGKIKQKLAYIHAFSAFLGCEGSGTFCALVLRTQYR